MKDRKLEKLTTTQETILRKIVSSVMGVGGIGSTINFFPRGTLATVIALVVFGLMTANPETAMFGDFLGAILSPVLAGMGLIGGILWVGFASCLLPSNQP